MKFLCLLFFFFIVQTYAATLKVIGPCSEEPLFEAQTVLSTQTNAGRFTVGVLKEHGIPFQGEERGMNSIFNTPVGLEAMEVLNDREMLAYGWCYSVNDIEPALYPNEVILGPEDKVKWWFGYAHFLNGEWISQCEPSHTRRSPQFCD